MSLSKSASDEVTLRANQDFQQKMSRISGQSGVFFLGTIFTSVTSYLFKVYLARKLGAAALGVYALGMTVVGISSLFGALGLPQSAVRFVAEYKATGRLDKLAEFIARCLIILLGLNLLLGVGVMLLGPWVAVFFYHTPALSHYFSLFALIAILGVWTLFFGQVLAGYQDVAWRTMITNFVGSPLTIVVSVALVVLGYGLWGYILAQVISAVGVLILLVLAVWKRTPKEARIWPAKLPPLGREVTSFSAAVFAVNALAFLMAQADKILIGFYLNAREVGIYAVASSLVAFVPIILQSVNQIFTPVIAELHARGDRDLLSRLFQSLTKWIIALTLPLAMVMMIFAVPLMRVFGHDFEVGWAILIVGTIGQLVNCATGSAGFLLLMSGHQRALVRIEAISGALIVILNLIFIPVWGIMGAALASAAMAIVSNLLYLGEVKRKLSLWPYNRGYWRLLPPLLLACAVPWLLRTGLPRVPDWELIGIALLLSYLTFILGALLLGLEEDDRRIAGMLWSRVAASLGRA